MSSTEVIERIMSCTETDQQDNVQRQLRQVIPERFWEGIAESAEDEQDKNSKMKLYSLQVVESDIVLTFWDQVNRPKTPSLSMRS